MELDGRSLMEATSLRTTPWPDCNGLSISLGVVFLLPYPTTDRQYQLDSNGDDEAQSKTSTFLPAS